MNATQPVLVVVVNNQRDWRRVVDERWYRIPLKHVPQPTAADYLAFYLTKAFGVDRWQVRYYAPVLRYQLVSRRDLLPDEPAHPRADERYYRIELGPLQQLASPLFSRRLRRVTFIPTTLERLLTAADLVDLWQGDDAGDLLWTEFPDAALKATARLALEEHKQGYAPRRSASSIPKHT
jgi:hypothetical protein